jgi:hypothetical protein
MPRGAAGVKRDRGGFLPAFLALVVYGKENCSPFRKHLKTWQGSTGLGPRLGQLPSAFV